MTVPTPTSPFASPGERAGFDILLVDDDPAVRMLLIKALGQTGYTLQCATGGRSALELLAQYKFRLIITDIFMPDGDGLELIVQHSPARSRIPVLAFSGGSILGHPAAILKIAQLLGCHRIFEKPFALQEFLASVRELLPPIEGGDETNGR